MRLTALLVVFAGLCSCSLLRARHPDPPPLTTEPTCISNYGVTAVDVAVAAGSLIGAGFGTYLVAARPVAADGTSNVPVGVVMITGGASAAALFAISAGIGLPRVGACRVALAEWQEGAADRAAAAAAAEAAAVAAAAEAEAKRMEQRRVPAAELLRCPPDEVRIDKIGFDPDDPLGSGWSWVGNEAEGCGRAVWCGEMDGRAFCRPTEDYGVAAAQLAIETQCPAATMVGEQRQVFTKRTWDRGRREARGQVTWRITACGAAYVCVVTAGLAASVQCKAALAAPAAPPPAQP